MADDIILADASETSTGGFLGIGASKPEAGIILADEPVQEPTVGGELKKGLVAGVHQLRGFGYGLGALAGEVTGSEPLKQWGMEGAKEVEETVKQNYAPNVGSYKDINNLNDALHYATYGVATNIPNILVALAGGGAGAVIGKKVAATAVKDLTEEAAKSTIKKYMQRGAMTGAGLSSIGMETGTIASDQATETGAVHPVSAIIGGIAAGALDFIPEWYLMKRMGWFGDEVKGALGKRVASGFMKQVAMEAPTEAAQSAIERAAVPGKSVSNREAWDEYIDSFILGGLTGGVAGAVGGVAARKSTEDQTPAQVVLKDDQLGQEIERQLIENDPDGITKPPIIPPSQLTPVEPVLPVAVETPTAPVVPEIPIVPETVTPVVPEVTPAPVVEPAPMVIPEETKSIVEETKPPIPELPAIQGSELLPPDEISKLQSEADAANVKLIGIQDTGVGENPMPMFNLTEEGKESTFTVEPGETVTQAADRVRAKFEVKTPEITSEPAQEIAAIEKTAEPKPDTKIRTDILPADWKMEVGTTRTKEGHTNEAEVDWQGKRIVFADQKYINDPKYVNHELAHVVIERTLPDADREKLFDEYIKVKTPEWNKSEYPDNVKWIVDNKFHREEIAIDYGSYLNDPDSVSPELRTLFDKSLPKSNVETVKPEKPLSNYYKDQKGNIVQVRPAPQGNWTLYQSPDVQTKGNRVKKVTEESKAKGFVGPSGIWFKSEAEARQGLNNLAEKEGWQVYTPKEEELKKPKKISKEVPKIQPEDQTGFKMYKVIYEEPGLNGEESKQITFNIKAPDERKALGRAKGEIGWEGRKYGRELSMEDAHTAYNSMKVELVSGEGAGGGKGVTEKVTPTENPEPTPVFDESKSTKEVKVIDKDHMLEKGLTGTTPKDQKKYVLAAIDEAIKVAPEANIGEQILIEIPGDGDFKVINSITALESFKKKINQLKTGEGKTKISKPSNKPTGKDIEQIAKEAEEENQKYFTARQQLKESYIAHTGDYIQNAKKKLTKWQKISEDVDSKNITLKSLSGEFGGKTPSYRDIRIELNDAEKLVKDIEGRAKTDKDSIIKYYPSLAKELFPGEAKEFKFSRVAKPEISTSMKLLQSTVAPLSTQFRNAANIEVVKSESDLPVAIRTDMARREGNPVSGVFHEGTIYLVSDNISSKREGLVTVAHELFHDGYHKLFQSLKTNKTFTPYATQSNLLLDQIWNRHQAEISNTIIKQYGLDPTSSQDRRTAAEEWLAKQTPDSQPKWYDRLAAIIANFLRKAMPSMNITNAEVRTLIEDVRQTLINKAEPVLNAEGPVAKYSLIDKKTTDYLKDLTSKFHSNPQSVITDKFIKENVRPFLKTQNDLQFADKYFGLPWWNAKKYPAWRRAFEIFGIQRPERRGELMHGYAQLAEPFFKMEETMRAAGKSSKEIADAKDRINRVIITGDAQLGPQLKSLRTQLRETKDEAIKQQLQKRIEQIEQDNRYSDEQLLDGIKDDRGNIVKLSQEEVNTYASVRTALDSMFDSYIDHLQTMSFRTWSNQKWYAVLCQAAGMDLNKSQTAAIVGAGLDKAALLRARKIQPDIRRVFERVEQQIAQTPDADKIAAGEWYGKISDKMVAEITTLRQSISDLTGETDQDKLTKMTREIFSAYMMTRPQLKRIKTLRNLYKKQVAFFPRVREQGDYKLTVTELINNKEGLPVQEKKLFMGMFNTEKEGAQVYADAMARYGKNGVFPANVHYSIEKSTKTPEFAFQGVNDINMQKVLDSAIESMKVRDTFVNDKGEKINVQDYLRELGYQAIAKQFQSRGFGRHMTHRETGAIKGYKESDLQRVLFNYMTGMAGIMTKQESAADFLEHMKDVSQENNPKMFESLVKYGRDQLRNETAADKFSNKVRSFMFTWYLGGLLRPAIIQLTQNFVTGIPEHGKYLRSIGQGGAGKAESQYITAMKDVATKNMTSIEQRMQAQLFTEGVTVDQYIREIFGSLGTNLEQRFDKLLRWLAIPFSKMEMYNRQSAALTRFRPAYKLALSEGLSEEDAYKKAFESARNYVYDTHYAMGKANLPQIAQGEGMGIAVKTAYTFKSFTHNYVLEMAHSMSKGDFKTVMHSLAYIALFGGLMGLPFFKDLFEFAEKHFGWSFTKSIRQTLRGVGGKTLETFGMNGLPALLGANISGSIALGIPFMGEDSLATIGGVYEGQLVKFDRAAEAVGRGDWYRVSTNLAPEFMRNPLVAAEESTLGRDIFGTPGVSTTTRGRPVYDESGKPLSMTTGQAITKTLGFNPTEIGRQKEKDQTIRRQETYVQELKTDAGERYRIARINGDPKALSKMMAEVKDINKKIKDRGLESLVPRATVQKIIEASRESQTKKQSREMAYKKTEL